MAQTYSNTDRETTKSRTRFPGRIVLFLGMLLLVQLGLVWPIYPLFSGIYPMVLGLPLSFIWVICMLLASFTLLLAFYLTDPDNQGSE